MPDPPNSEASSSKLTLPPLPFHPQFSPISISPISSRPSSYPPLPSMSPRPNSYSQPPSISPSLPPLEMTPKTRRQSQPESPSFHPSLLPSTSGFSPDDLFMMYNEGQRPHKSLWSTPDEWEENEAAQTLCGLAASASSDEEDEPDSPSSGGRKRTREEDEDSNGQKRSRSVDGNKQQVKRASPWHPRAKLVFLACVAHIPPQDRGTIMFLGKACGRNELFARILGVACKKPWGRKQISSHSQTLKQKNLAPQAIQDKLTTTDEQRGKLKTSGIPQGPIFDFPFHPDLYQLMGFPLGTDLNKAPTDPKIWEYIRNPALKSGGQSNASGGASGSKKAPIRRKVTDVDEEEDQLEDEDGVSDFSSSRKSRSPLVERNERPYKLLPAAPPHRLLGTSPDFTRNPPQLNRSNTLPVTVLPKDRPMNLPPPPMRQLSHSSMTPDSIRKSNPLQNAEMMTPKDRNMINYLSPSPAGVPLAPPPPYHLHPPPPFDHFHSRGSSSASEVSEMLIPSSIEPRFWNRDRSTTSSSPGSGGGAAGLAVDGRPKLPVPLPNRPSGSAADLKHFSIYRP